MNLEDKKIEEAIEKFGTPLYIFDIDILFDTVKKFRTGLGNDVGLCYAMKANPFVTDKIFDVVDKIEVCSMGEFRICKELNIPPEKVLISGVLKKEDDILEILQYYGVECCYTVESLYQFDIFDRWSRKNQKKLRIYPRLTSGNQFGLDKELIDEIIKFSLVNPYLEVVGIHYFSGTQKKNVGKIKKELEFLDEILLEFEENLNYKLSELEYGPGFAVSYFENQNDTTEEDIYELRKVINDMKWNGKVTFEMGRAFAADCGYYLTTVKDVKCNGGINFCIVDGGLHQMNYDGQIRGMYKPVTSLFPKRDDGNIKGWNVCGSLCTANDVLVQNALFDGLKIGDVIVFCKAGAYSVTEGMALFLSHSLPEIITYSMKDDFNILRNRMKTFKLNMKNNN